MQDSSTSSVPAEATKSKTFTKAKTAIGALVFTALVATGAWYWRYTSLHPSTNDAYVGAHVVRLGPMVSGQVASVDAKSFAQVVKGDVLLTLDDTPYKASLQAALAERDKALQAIGANTATVASAEALLAERQAELDNTRKQSARTLKLARKGDVPRSAADDARAALKTAESAVNAAQAKVRQALAELGKKGTENASYRAAEAKVAQAQFNLGHTVITAPADGVLGKVSIRKGAMVTPGQALFPLVETSRYWVDANFKETDLKRIRPGQPADIKVDMYPDKVFNGRVSELSPASGVSFSLLPPENATGNWVKVTQRFPVRVLITDGTDQNKKGLPQLRIGASATVHIDTSGGSNG